MIIIRIKRGLFFLFLWLWLRVLSAQQTEDALICDGPTPLAHAFSRSVYDRYPFAHSYNCVHLVELLHKRNANRDALLAQCQLEDARLADQAAGVNARVPVAELPPFFGLTDQTGFSILLSGF